jgi:hypothetical protein
MTHLTTYPMAGGTLHGDTFTTQTPTSAIHALEPGLPPTDDVNCYWPTPPREVIYHVRKYAVQLPGRTDQQAVKVMVHQDYRDAPSLIWDAVLQAWAKGWTPADDTSCTRQQCDIMFHPGWATDTNPNTTLRRPTTEAGWPWYWRDTP